MNKRQILASLNNIANTLDNSGLYKEANTITNVMKKLAQEQNLDNPPFDIPDDSEQQIRDIKHSYLNDILDGHPALMVIVDLYNEIENLMYQMTDPKALDYLATKEINQGDDYFDNYYRQIIEAIKKATEDSSQQTKILVKFMNEVSKNMNIFNKKNYTRFLTVMMTKVLEFEKSLMQQQNDGK
jgi:hypothetical protein